jgi:pimeloyl-ACP methyl ester carboxylesterase
MTARARANRDADTPPPVRRGYFECRYGQIHVHNAMPRGGGFEEGTTLLCLHEVPLSGRMFERSQSLLGRERSVYAPDLPGYGQSDPPPAQLSIAEYAAVIGDFLDLMRFRQIDLLGSQIGALIAAELAITRPSQVRRIVWASVPLLDAAGRSEIAHSPWSRAPGADGAQLQSSWQVLANDGKNILPDATTAHRLADALRAGANPSWSLQALAQYSAEKRLGLVTQPVLLMRASGPYWQATARVRELVPKARLRDFADHGPSFWESAPEAVADAVATFLR